MENGRKMGTTPDIAAVVAANRVVEAKKVDPGGLEHLTAIKELAAIVANNPIDRRLLGTNK